MIRLTMAKAKMPMTIATDAAVPVEMSRYQFQMECSTLTKNISLLS